MKKYYLFSFFVLCSFGMAQAQDYDLSPEGVLTISASAGQTVIPYNYLGSATFDTIRNNIRSIVINEGITGIGKNAFTSNLITSISIPASVTEIENDALPYCRGLTSISVDANNMVYSSEEDALFDKEKTELIAFPAGKTGSYTTPESVKIIGNNAFQNSRLTSIDISASVTTIGKWVFYGNYMTSINLPASVESIGQYSFLFCYDLTSLTVDADNQVYSSKDDVLFNKDQTILYTYAAGKQGSYTIPESVNMINECAFWCSFQLTSVTIPHSVTDIGDHAFYYCANLTSVIIPSSVKTIANNTFSECTRLTSVVIPASVTYIDANAFSLCNNLSEIFNLNPEPQEIFANTFASSIFAACTLRVPSASLDEYMIADVWNEFTNVLPFDDDITVNRVSLFMLSNTTAALTATISGNISNPLFFQWKTENTNIAGIDHTGTVTALSPGSTVITTSFAGFERACKVTVVAPGKSSIDGSIGNPGTENMRMNLYMKE